MGIGAHEKLPQLIGLALVAGCALLTNLPSQAQTPSVGGRLEPSTSPGPDHYSDNQGRWILGAQVGYSMEYGLDWHKFPTSRPSSLSPKLDLLCATFKARPYAALRLSTRESLAAPFIRTRLK